MDLIWLVIIVGLVCLLVWVATNLPPPFRWVVIGVAAIVVLVVLLQFLGADTGTTVVR